jgi:hypothetical protein
MRLVPFLSAVGLAAALATPAAAEVVASSDDGFVSHTVVEVAATPAEAWARLSEPGQWWNSEHTYSGDAANLTIEPVAGGCFCETIPAANGVAAGQVEHMRVVYVDPRARTLRLRGSLGPLQAEALTGVLTMTVQPSDTGAKITWDYVVGGYAAHAAEGPGSDSRRRGRRAAHTPRRQPRGPLRQVGGRADFDGSLILV